MKNRNAFTLIELLVVIAIIALLMSILIPNLNRVREQAQSIYCRSLFKSIGLANHMYADTYDDWFVPIDGAEWNSMWYSNRGFIKNLSLIGKEVYGKRFQEVMICPSASENTASVNYPWNRYTIASNMVGMKRRDVGNPVGAGGGWGGGSYLGLMRGAVRRPSEKLMYIDSTGWFYVTLTDADYREVWDVWGDVNGDYSWRWGGTAYRHSEGANVLFCDGHVDYLKKEEIYDIEDASSNDKLWKFEQ